MGTDCMRQELFVPEKMNERIDQTERWHAPSANRSLFLSTFSWERVDPPWWLIQATVDSAYGETDSNGSVFCVLGQTERNTYIQLAYCGDGDEHGWRLECRITNEDGTYTHYYATEETDGSRKAKTLSRLMHAREAFRDFYEGRSLSDFLEWHVMES